MSSSKFTNSNPPRGEIQQVVSPEAAGFRLDQFLSRMPGILSRQMGRRLILQGVATLNGKQGEPSKRVAAGDRVAYWIPPPETSSILPQQGALDIVHEDSALLVINKPAGTPMHPGPGHREETLVHYLLGHCGDLSGIGGTLRPGIVHRLDMDTTGLVVVAKHDAAHLHLAAQFKAHAIHRIYHALVVGNPRGAKGRIDLPLDRDPKNRLKRSVSDSGKPAVTHWWLERRMGPFALLRIQLETGRTHQIRVHLSQSGWPVLGDPLYGKRRHRGLRLPTGLAEELETLGRQALHASELGFVHPETGKQERYSTPLPPDFQRVLEALECYRDSAP